MKSILKLTGWLTAVLLIFNSCSKTNNAVKMIPSNALVVIHLNTKSLMAKLPWDDVKQTGWFKELYKDSTVKTWTKTLMDNPAASGIDFDEAFIIFAQKAGGTNGQLVFEGTVKDAGAFEAFNKNLDEKATVAKDGDINLLALKDETVVGWNNTKFAYVLASSKFTTKINYAETPDTLSNNGQAINNTLTLSAVCKKLFALNPDSSMAKVEKFSTLLKEDGDVHLWQNTEEIINSTAQLGMLSMMKLDALLKGNISTATASFDNGKITVKQKFYASPELTDVLKKYGGTKINTDMIKNIPSQNIDGLLAVNFKPEGLKEIIKLTGMDGIINNYISQQGFTIDDFVKANKGDLLFAVTDFMMKKDSFNFKDQALKDTSYSYSKPSASYLFSISIGDKASFDKLMATGKKLGGDLPQNIGVYFTNTDKIFAVGNSQEYLSKYVAGGNNKFDFIDKMADHPIAFFVDIQKILLSSSAGESTKDSLNKFMLDESLKTWQNIYALGGEFKEDAFVMNTEINLVDKNINSLKQLNTYFDRISKAVVQKTKKYEQSWQQVDSFDLYPPMTKADTMPLPH